MGDHKLLTSNELIGFHGTTSNSSLSIIKNGFRLSQSQEDWLGHGVYFFTYGISDPLKNAIEWSKNSHGSKCVIKVKVNVDDSEILDLRTTDGLKVYNHHRDEIVKNYYEELEGRRDISIKKRKDIRVDDCIIMGFLMDIKSYKAVIHNVYIKNQKQRRLALESCYPNSTVLCVNELSSLEVIEIIDM